ncbi:hypothetical protein MKW98_021749, partial [Papaver atlanticum]
FLLFTTWIRDCEGRGSKILTGAWKSYGNWHRIGNGENSTGIFRLNTLGALCADFGGYGIAYEIEATDYNVVGEEIQGYGVAAELMWNCFFLFGD